MKTSQTVGLALLLATSSQAVMVTSIESSSPTFEHEPEGWVRVNFVWAHDEGFDIVDTQGNRAGAYEGTVRGGAWSHETPGVASAGIHGWAEGWTMRVQFDIATGVIMDADVYMTHLPFQDITAIPGQGITPVISYDQGTFSGSVTWSGTPEITPEPVPDNGATLGLLALVLVGIAAFRRHK